MNKLKSIMLMVFFYLLITTTANAFDYSANIFKFQTKLAQKGDATAQYKLATMYESGTGTKKDLDEALKWYKKASDQNNKAAIRRITYIEIIKNGYNEKEHLTWLTTLIHDAAANNGEAAFLLGTMYKNGVAVKGSLLKAKKLFRIASQVGVSGADHELINIKNLMSTKREQAAKKRKKSITNNKIKQKKREAKKIVQRKQAEKKRLAEKNKKEKTVVKPQTELAKIQPKEEPIVQKVIVETPSEAMSEPQEIEIKPVSEVIKASRKNSDYKTELPWYETYKQQANN